MKLDGVIIPMATPFGDQDELDEGGLRRLVEHLVGSGVHGIFALGSTGEFAILGDTTREKVISAVIDAVNRRVPVLVGASAPGTTLAMRNVKMAERHGADAVVITAGFYYPQSDSEVEKHLRTIAAAAKVPVVLYNIPQRVGRTIPLPIVERLVSDGLVSAIKDSSGDMRYLVSLLDLKEKYPDFSVLQGDEFLMTAALLAGVDGLVPGIGNLAATHCVKLYEAAKLGDYRGSYSYQTVINRLNRIFEQGSPYGGLKEALSQIGVCGPKPALSSAIPDMSQRQFIADLIAEAGIEAKIT